MELPAGRQAVGVALDASVGGMFIACEEPVDIGTPLVVSCSLSPSSSSGETRLVGTVRWTKPGGFGVQFGLLGAHETHALVELVGAARSGGPVSSRRLPPPSGTSPLR